jgi:hypothetical protein
MIPNVQETKTKITNRLPQTKKLLLSKGNNQLSENAIHKIEESICKL